LERDAAVTQTETPRRSTGTASYFPAQNSAGVGLSQNRGSGQKVQGQSDLD
jgi:hypothetical protein